MVKYYLLLKALGVETVNPVPKSILLIKETSPPSFFFNYFLFGALRGNWTSFLL
jgi:hypothetical protein